MLVPVLDRVRVQLDVREQVVSFPPQGVITKDNLLVGVDSVLYYSIIDPKAATYAIENYVDAIEQLVVTTLRNVIGGMQLEEALTGRDQINSLLAVVLDEATGKWGIKVNRVEIRGIEPPPTIRDAMEQTMRADRGKRAAILTAEGHQLSAVLSAQGEKKAAVLRAEAAKEARILDAQAEREALAAARRRRGPGHRPGRRGDQDRRGRRDRAGLPAPAAAAAAGRGLGQQGVVRAHRRRRGCSAGGSASCCGRPGRRRRAERRGRSVRAAPPPDHPWSRVRSGKQQEFVLRTLEERDIRFVRLWFTDVLGTLKSVAIAPAELEGAFDEGLGFDGSAIEGFSRVQESDMLAVPDPATFQVLPWRAEERATARMFCDITMPDGTPSWADPRHVLRRALSKAADSGFTFYTHPEVEFFLLKDLPPQRRGARAGRLRRLLRPHPARRQPGLPPRGDHDARADGHLGGVQPPRGRAGPAGDRPALRRRAVHRRQRAHHPARHQGGRAEPGRVRHLHAQAVQRPARQRHAHPPVAVRGRHQRLPRRHRPAAPEQGRPSTSSPACCATRRRSPPSPTSGSTPTSGCGPAARRRRYVCWGSNNRSALVRVPMYKPTKSGSTRIEVRSPDSATNPYLASRSCWPPGSRASRRSTRCRRAPRTTSGR